MLYVEDNPANMKLVEQLVGRRSDIKMLGAVNGTLAIDIARDLKVPIVPRGSGTGLSGGALPAL